MPDRQDDWLVRALHAQAERHEPDTARLRETLAPHLDARPARSRLRRHHPVRGRRVRGRRVVWPAALALAAAGAGLVIVQSGSMSGVDPDRVTVRPADSGAAPTAPSAPPGPSTTSAGSPSTASAAPTMAPATGTPADSSTGRAALAPWPSARGTVTVRSTVRVSGVFDGRLERYSGIAGSGSSQPPMFDVADGGTVQNVIIGASAGDGIHCLGSCTLRNVWWETVGDDAATLKGTSPSQVMTIDGGGARHAPGIVIEHNGPGTVVIRNFQALDIGKLYRSCGNCSTQYRRAVVIQNVRVAAPAQVLVGVNANNRDVATLSGITVLGDQVRSVGICWRYTGNTTGADPVKVGSGPDPVSCRYDPEAITYG